MRAIFTVMISLSIVPVVAAQTRPVIDQSAPSLPRAPEPSRGTLDPFAQEAGSILVGKCLACHGPEKKKGGLDLSRRDLGAGRR